MSTHTKFNPEGVKGRTAQPPHKIFNFMEKQHWTIKLKVVDLNTRIELPSWTWYGVSNSQWRAERKAIRAYKGLALDRWSAMVCNKYRLTAKQLERLINDGLITPPDLFEITVAKVESEPWVPSPIGDDGLEPFVV